MSLSFAVRIFASGLLSCSLLAPAFGATPPAIDQANFDRDVAPSHDFYRFAVGGWLARSSIPPDRTSWGAFDELEERNESEVRTILESSDQTEAPVGSERRKLGDFYNACMDTDEIEVAGISALEPRLRDIAAMPTAGALATLFAASHAIGSSPGFAFGPEQDPRNAKRVIASLGQGGLSLPTPDYYTSRAPRSKAIRAALARYMRRVFVLLGDSPAQSGRETTAVMGLETRLAAGSKAPDALRDPFENMHSLKPAALRALAPNFAWGSYFAESGVSASGWSVVDVGQPGFVRAFNAEIRNTPLATWKSYLRWHDVSIAGSALPKAFRDAAFEYRRVESGVRAPAARPRVCGNLTAEALGFALGKVYVERYFPPQARERARTEVALIKAALRDDIATVSWMGPQTRAAALAKLAKLDTSKVGYPDRWRDYSTLNVERDAFLRDLLAARRFETKRDNAKIGKPVDRSEWGLTPQTVNAYYDPSMNEIELPAAILQPPFFDPTADDAVNFGGIGAVIGHEMTHGFDDQGSDYDGDGNLHPVVTKADSARFHARVACIVRQLSSYRASDGLHLVGKLDAGEATADLGGTTLAYRALQTALGASSRPAPIDGYSPEQRFYLSWAQVWRELQRPEAERAQILGDPHPIARYRVNGTLSDQTNFYKAFDVGPGSGMWKPQSQRCQIW